MGWQTKILFLLLTTSMSGLYGQPEIWMQDRVIDLGVVYREDQASEGLVFKSGEFEIKNVGDQPLLIGKIKGEAFTTITYPDGKIIDPGQTSRIEFQLGFFPSATQRKEKRLTIFSNQSDRVFLLVTAQVFSDAAERERDEKGGLQALISEENNGFGNLAVFFTPTGRQQGMGYYDLKQRQKVGEWKYWDEAAESSKKDETVPAYFTVYNWQGQPEPQATFTVRSGGRSIEARINSQDTSAVYRLDLPRKPFEVTIRAGQGYYTYVSPKEIKDGVSEAIYLSAPGLSWYIEGKNRFYFKLEDKRFGIALHERLPAAQIQDFQRLIQHYGLREERLPIAGPEMKAIRLPASMSEKKQDTVLSKLFNHPAVANAGPLVPHPAPQYGLMTQHVRIELDRVRPHVEIKEMIKGKPFQLTRETPFTDLVELTYTGVPGYGMIKNFNALRLMPEVTSVLPVFLK